MKTSKGRLLIGALSFVTLGLGLVNLGNEIWTMSSGYIVAAIEDDEIGPVIVPYDLARSRSALAIAGCKPDLYRRTVTLQLARLDAVVADAAAVSPRTELDDADRLLQQALSCNPYDGNLWLRSASLELVRTGNLRRAVEFLRMSQLFAPSEAWIIRARLPVASALTLSKSGTEQILKDDFKALATSKWSRDAANFYLQVPAATRTTLDQVIGELSPEAAHPFKTWLHRLQGHRKS
jgi:hypothetical protein